VLSCVDLAFKFLGDTAISFRSCCEWLNGSRPVKHTISASARRKIAAAQRLRWAKVTEKMAA
jgi:hypothetical protein